MNKERRRRARVQGSWASAGPSSSSNIGPGQSVKGQPTYTSPMNQVSNTVQPIGYKFTYQDSKEKIRVKPKSRVIDEDGTYELSDGPNGSARVILVKNFVKPELCVEYFQHFVEQIPWEQKAAINQVSGEEYLQPRLTAWFGDHSYSYSNVTQEPTKEWGPYLTSLKQQIEEFTGKEFNSTFANLYRNSKDHIPWHTDAQYRLGKLPTIVSLTFGAVRTFELRKMLPRGSSEEDYEYVEHVEVPLDAGTLLVMEGAVQEDWHHRVRREYHDKGPRINFTFRSVLPPTE